MFYLKKSGHFHKLQTDRGSEFLNKPFQAWLRKQKIELFHSHNYEIKASIAERFICTIKEKLWRYFTHKNTRRYIDVIQSVVDSYNNSYHSSIKCTPASVNTENQETVWLTLYGDLEPKQPKLKVVDQVRLSKTRKVFGNSYLPRWTEELFVVAEAISDDPPYYKIKDLNNEMLEGTFYDAELQKVHKNNNIFRIESILQKRRRNKQLEFLVKWLGYPETFNSWVPKRDIVHYA